MASNTIDEPPVFRRFFKAADTSPLCDGVRPTSCNPSHCNEGNFAGDRNNRAQRLKASDEGPSSFGCGATLDVILASFCIALGCFLAARRFASTCVEIKCQAPYAIDATLPL